jgi:hypothetical protein
LQERNQLAIQVTNLQVELDNANMRADEAIDAADSARGQLQKLQLDYQLLKSQYDKDLVALTEQFDDSR